MLENNSADLTIGFDVGGTNVRGGVITRDGDILASRTMPTSGDPRQLDDDLVAIVEELRADYPVGAVGLAVAGFLDPECETVRFAPHLPWRNAPVRKNLAERLGLHVRLEHDANSAAWGEWRRGAARGQGGVQVQLRLDQEQRGWLDEQVARLGAPSRSAMVASVYDAWLPKS